MVKPQTPLPQLTKKYFKRRWWALVVLSLALFMASLDNTILNVALPTLASQLHASTDQLQWTVDAYQVTFAGLLLVAGAFVDRWGRAKTFLVGTLIFGVCSLAAGLSPNTHILIIFRSLMGVGAALLTPSTLALVSAIFRDHKERTAAFAIWSGANAAGGATGPLLSGILLEHFSWGSIFFINVPVAVVILILGPVVLPFLTPTSTVKGLDIVGALVSTSALALVCWAVISAPGLGLVSLPIITTFLAGIGLLLGFIFWEARFAAPILDLKLFTNRRFAVAVSVAGLVTAGGAAALFILTQYLQFNLGYNPLDAGLRILPVALALGAGAVAAPKLIEFLRLKITVLIGLGFVAAGFIWLATATVNTGYVYMLIGALAFGLGAGILNPAATQAVMDALPPRSSGVGSATNSTLMQVGSAIGVALGGALLSARYRAVITGSDIFDQLGSWRNKVLESYAGAIAAAEELKSIGVKIIATAKAGFVDGMSWALVCSAILVVAAGLAVWFAYPKDRQ